MEKVRILAVGVGGFAQGYLAELLQEENPDFEFVGMVEVMPQSHAAYQELVRRGVPLYTTMEEFYAQHTADLAIIVTPTHFHTRQILCALNHGSNVMCEKPLTGNSADEEILVKTMQETGKFVIIGYQWSYAKAILDLKADIMAGLYGKPLLLKSLVLWPRPKSYYRRGGGWGGKIYAPDGSIINDSVVSNATAHYLHNMLYVTGGADGRSSEVTELDCTLLRVNEIENFDTATLQFTMDNGAKGIYIVSHSTEETVHPHFEYRFEKGVVTYSSTTYSSADQVITGTFADGTVKIYGDPFADIQRKVYLAIEKARNPEGFIPACGVPAAAPQVRCVEKIQTHTIHPVRKDRIAENPAGEEVFLYVPELGALLKRCYGEEKILSDYPEFEKLVEA